MTWRDIRRLGSTPKARRRPSPVVTARRDTHVTHEQSPVRAGIDAQMPNSMPRAEDDGITRAGSRDVHDQKGSGGNTACRHLFF